MPSSRKVVLFHPPYAGTLLGAPLGLLSLAGSLRQAGFQPLIVDAALDRRWRQTVAEEIRDCSCFGVSLLTGPMILDAIEVSRMVKRLRPALPVVFGGWHPTLESAQTLREDFVDVVVRHQGEATLVELLSRLESGRELDFVAGCWFKRNGRIIRNPDRPQASLAQLPAPAYDLIDFDAYERATGERKLPYAASLGCPYACNYCTDMVYYRRRFDPYETQRVVAEMTSLASRYRLSEIALVDSNFLVDVPRAIAIARGIRDSTVRFKWSFQASTNLLCRMSADEVKILAQSGVHHIGFGSESASPEVLRRMNKAHQNIPDMYETAAKCANAGIRVTFNLIFGFPGEQDKHRRETLRVVGDIARQFANVSFSPNLFTPYPGIPIWPDLERRGLQKPDSLLNWARIDLGANHLPWMSGASLQKLERSIRYVLLHARLNGVRRACRSRLLRALLDVAEAPVLWRLKQSLFAWPWELALARTKIVRRSLLNGRPLSRILARGSPKTSAR
ncbi:MAG TPA: radical SAM protein [Bryobacteraceae bacterium]|nr:radical SAM protein [Bryobacteraceae bacterium]